MKKLKKSSLKKVIVLKSIRNKKAILKKYRLQDLVAQIPASFQKQEINWKEPKGKEKW